MGNTLRKKKRNSTVSEDKKSLPLKSVVAFNAGTSVQPSMESIDEYIKEEMGSVVSASSCTRPSPFNSQETSNQMSDDKKSEEVETITLNERQFQSMYEQFKSMNPDKQKVAFKALSEDHLIVIRHLLNLWQTDLIHKFDSYKTYVNTVDCGFVTTYTDILRKFSDANVQEMILQHTLKVLVTLRMILDRQQDTKRLEELTEQLAIFHGLLGVEGKEFRVFDVHMTNYLLQKNLINDESVITLVAFLSIIAEEISRVVNERRKRAEIGSTSTEPINYRFTITRENYRCMKEWTAEVCSINARAGILDKQIKKQEAMNISEVNENEVSKASGVIKKVVKKRIATMKDKK